ncbi:MAG: hypothetical protein ACLUQK_03745 [Clostridium sp.]
MAKSKIIQANEIIARKVVGAFGKIENTVVDRYAKIENVLTVISPKMGKPSKKQKIDCGENIIRKSCKAVSQC